MAGLTIGKVAQQAGIGIETVRFYERSGLIRDPDRTPAGYRQYGEDAVLRLRFIKRAKEVGFSLKEIKELLSLQVNPRRSCARVQDVTDKKIREVDAKIEDLQRMRRSLAGLLRDCRNNTRTSRCPILDSLAEDKS
jgi:Hg(II)-responsive transcriptional regulator|tara:strand:- start:1211 stop:1618 length:408 start_codon:yes stop_codon:yes gene_type:complete